MKILTDAHDSEPIRSFTHSLIGIVDVSTYEVGSKILLAAIDVIRKPSEAQMAAGLDYFYTVAGTDEDQVRNHYQVMLDALKRDIAK